MSTRVTPNSMTSPSRVVNVDRFMDPLQCRKATKEDSTVGRTVLVGGGTPIVQKLRVQASNGSLGLPSAVTVFQPASCSFDLE